MVTIDFEYDNGMYGVFRDALHLPDDHGLSDAEIEALKQARINNWLLALNPPPQEPPAEQGA